VIDNQGYTKVRLSSGNDRYLRNRDVESMSRIDVKLPFAMTGPKTTAGKGVFRIVADILRLIAELRAAAGHVNNVTKFSLSRVPRKTTGDLRRDERKIDIRRRATASRPPEHIYKPRRGFKDISVLLKFRYGRSLSPIRPSIWRMPRYDLAWRLIFSAKPQRSATRRPLWRSG
jgi:hypothetical protein